MYVCMYACKHACMYVCIHIQILCVHIWSNMIIESYMYIIQIRYTPKLFYCCYFGILYTSGAALHSSTGTSHRTYTVLNWSTGTHFAVHVSFKHARATQAASDLRLCLRLFSLFFIFFLFFLFFLFFFLFFFFFYFFFFFFLFFFS